MKTRKEFIDDFVVVFCATWAANNQGDYCARGRQEEMEKFPVMEDAIFLADQAYMVYSKAYENSNH